MLSSMSTMKKILLSLLVIGAVTSAVTAGTFATFTAQTTNPSNTFATGTLVMSNKVGSNTACLSTGGGSTDTNAQNCDTAFNLSVKKPGDSGTVNLTLQNVGSLNAGAFTLSTTGCTNSDASGESYHGTGNPCSAVQIYVQETQSDFSTAVKCWYGGGTATTCDFSDTSKTLADFATNYNSVSTGVNLIPSGFNFNAGTTRYFVIGVKLPSTAGNNLQGRAAAMPLVWYMQQQ